SEKKILEKYLSQNEEAKILHKELLRTEELLDTLPETEPSENLKKKILNSIDYNLYQSKKSKSFIPENVLNIFFGSKFKTAMSFGLVLITAGILFSAIFFNSYYKNLFDKKNTFATIGFPETTFLQSIKINTGNISGEINISRGIDFYQFDVDLNSHEKYKLQIEYDSKNISLKDYPLSNNISVNKSNGTIVLSNSSTEPYEILFSSKSISWDKFFIKVFRNEHILFEKELVLKND
ncbi:MAG: hypothetical protein V3V16_03660, partial [Melioribacteraceae bacterium]